MSKKEKTNSLSFLKSLGLTTENLLDVFDDYLVILNEKFKIIYYNKKTKNVLGSDIYNKIILDFLPKDEKETVLGQLQKIIQKKESVFHDVRGEMLSGNTVWLSVTASPVLKNNKVVAIIVLARDITVKKNYEETLLKDILGQKKDRIDEHKIPDQIFLVNREGRFLDFSLSKDFKPYASPEFFLGKRFEDILPHDVAWKSIKTLEKAFKTTKPQTLEYQLYQDGENKNFEARFLVMNENECMLIVRDISESLAAKKEFVKLLSEEQKRLGHDLHDGLSQHLTGIAFLGKVLEKKLYKQKLKEYEEAAKIVSLVNDAIDHTRSLAQGFHLVEIETSGLEDVLQKLCSTTEKIYKIKCLLTYDKKAKFEDVDEKMHLYRMAQEAVNNAIKHAQTKKVHIKVLHRKNSVIFSVSNDGRAFQEHLANKQGAGLKIMQYRASMIGASFEIHHNEKEGTVVSFEIYRQ